MPQPPKPCAHCGSATFYYLPNMKIDIQVATTVLGMQATKEIKGHWWSFNVVACTQCGLTQMFTTNAQQVAQLVPGSGVHTVPPR